MIDPMWVGAKVIQFNYGGTRGSTTAPAGRISFFLKGVLSCLSAMRHCLEIEINSGKDTLFWRDRWHYGRAPMYL